ncbi:MAG: BON domain-containing protein [Alphaproteobacteria bacterium]|nr:BON domain-containing protein [Alphaproteobacteria bacterium]
MKHTRKLAAVSAFVLALAASSAAFGESAGKYMDDAAITTKVKAALLADLHFKAADINVDTNQGTVVLSGTVDTTDDESKAVKDANQVSGVKAVQDHLTASAMKQESKPTTGTSGTSGAY